MSVRKNSSVIWHHFEKDDQSYKGTCNVCNEILSYKSSITNLKSHLRRKHPSIYLSVFDTDDQLQQSASSYERTAYDLELESIQNTYSSPIEKRQTNINAFDDEQISDEQKEEIDKDLLDLCIDSFHPFSIVDERSFKKFCRWIPGYKLPTRKTLSGPLFQKRYNKSESDIISQLAGDVQTICISTDFWTSEDSESYIAITGHYITQELDFKTVMLGCSNISGDRTAENIASEIEQILNNWQLKEKVNFAVSKNEENIVMALQNLLTIKHFECFAQTLNLIVEEALLCMQEMLIEKINKIVAYFKRSAVLSEALATYQLQQLQEPKKLIQYDAKRWNTAFYMIERIVELKDAVLSTLALAKDDLPLLSNEDWSKCVELCKVLRPFELMTREMSEERYLRASSVIIMVRCLKEACRIIIDNSKFSDQVNNVSLLLMSGLNERFSAIEQTDALALNTFLDPRFKLQAFSDTHEALKTKETVMRLVASSISQNEATLVANVKKESTKDEFNPWDIYESFIPQSSLTDTPLSKAIKEIDLYLTDEILPRKEDPLQWWKSHGHVYPNLLQLFIKHCNIVATSTPCERMFAKSGLIFDQRRTRLSSTKVEQLMFLNVNLDSNRFQNYM